MSVTPISGVTGVGLSSVCREARRRLSDEYTLINFGDSMLEQAATAGITTDRDELSSLSRREIRRLQRRAGEYVADVAEDDRVLLATHLTVKTENGFIDGLPNDVLNEITPQRFVVLEATPETILDRRERSDRSVDLPSPRAVEFEQHLNRAAAFEYARELNAPVQFVENEDDIDEAAEAVVGLLSEES
ncbi:adenylate kinase [Halorubrum luteum]